MGIQVRHEGVRVVLLHVPNAIFAPRAFEHLLGTDHCRDSGGVRDGLAPDFFEALLVIADVVDIDGFRLAVFDAGDHVADAGAALGALSEVARVGEHGFEELKRNDFLPLIDDGVDAGHAHILQDFQVLEVVGGEAHPELSPAQGRDVFHEGFEFLVVHPVDFVGANFFRAGERLMQGHGGGFDKRSVFPVAAFGGDFTDVDFRVEVGGESVAVVAAIDVDDVQCVNFIEMVLQGPGGENIGDAGVEAGAKQGGATCREEPLLKIPLPGVFELGDVLGFVVGSVKVVATRFQAGFHQGEILIGQGDIDQEPCSSPANQFGGFGDVIGIDLSRGNFPAGAHFHVGCDRFALGNRAGGERDFTEDLGNHGAFVGDDIADATGADDQDLVHDGGS